MKNLIGIALIVFALAVAIIPQVSTCEYNGKFMTLASGMTAPMKCSWSAKAEIAAGVPLLAVGVMMITSRRKESLKNLSVMGAILGAFVMAIPTSLIGVCSSQMPCNLIMKPSLIGLGALATAASLGMLITAQFGKKEAL